MKIFLRAAMVAAVTSALVAPRVFAQATNAAPPAPAPLPAIPTPAAPAEPAPTAAPAAPVATPTNAPAKKPAPKKKAPAKPVAKKPETKPAEAKSQPVLNPEPGAAKQNNVNIRGQASMNGEVIGKLKKDEPVTILEEITLKKPKADEPARWFRIALPPNVTAWVHSSFVDTNAGAVKARKLNVRGGPGENYSVIGTLEKGAPIKPIDAKGQWLKIEPPTNAYAFVAAHLLERTPGAAIASATPKTTPATPPTKGPEIAATTPPPVPAAPPATVTEVPATATPVPGAPVATAAPAAPVTPAPAETPATAAPAAPSTPAVATTPSIPAEDTSAPIEPVRKLVTREGVLKGSVSIQAPTFFELRSLETGKAIDYIYSPSTNLVLKQFKGKRIIVTGEEVLDERWQHTPVLVVETLQTVQ